MLTNAEICELRVCLLSLGRTLLSDTGAKYLKAYIGTLAEPECKRYMKIAQLMVTCMICSNARNDAILRAARELAEDLDSYDARNYSIRVSAPQLNELRDTNDIEVLRNVSRDVFAANTADDSPLYGVFRAFRDYMWGRYLQPTQ